MPDVSALDLLSAPEVRELSHGAARTYWVCLALAGGLGGDFVRPQKRIAELAGSSPRAAVRHFRELEAADLVEIGEPGAEYPPQLRRYTPKLPGSLRP